MRKKSNISDILEGLSEGREIEIQEDSLRSGPDAIAFLGSALNKAGVRAVKDMQYGGGLTISRNGMDTVKKILMKSGFDKSLSTETSASYKSSMVTVSLKVTGDKVKIQAIGR
jgi:hypothetical protein